MAINTYNGESNLSQVLQFSLMCVETVPEKYEDRLPMADFYIVMLQIHQGADVRGGYTAPAGFTVRNLHSPEGMVLSSDGYIYCNGCEAHWQTDDGYHWYEDGDASGNKRPLLQLEKATFVDIEDELVEGKSMWDSLQEFLGNPNVAPPVPDEQLSLMGDDSDIRANRNHLRNRQDIRGWGVANQYVLVDEDHNGYCPFCGDKLEGGF